MATLALNAPEKDLFQVLLPSPGRLRGSLETRLSPLSPSLSLFILSSHSLSSCLLLSEFPQVHPSSWVRDHPNDFIFATSAKTPFPSKATFGSTGC